MKRAYRSFINRHFPHADYRAPGAPSDFAMICWVLALLVLVLGTR